MNKRGLLVVLLLILLAINVNAVYYVREHGVEGFLNIFDFGARFGSGDQIVNWYENNSSLVDFFIFLVIFLGLGRTIFGEHFKGAGGKGVYVGIGIFLALSLLIWEQKSGFSLVGNFGIWALLIFILVIIFYIYKLIHQVTGSSLFAISLAYILLYIFFLVLDNLFGMTGDYWIYDIIDSIYFNLGIDLFSISGFLFLLAILGLIFGFFMRKKSKD
jgi:ABC-type multidrug transport system fused ATPase/permease subunit